MSITWGYEDRKIIWLVGLAVTFQLVAQEAIPEGALQNMVIGFSLIMDYFALYLIVRTDWLGIGAFIRRRRSRR